MMSGFGWAKNPMLNRIHEIRDDKSITLLYGSRSWIDKSSWDLVKQARSSSFVNTQVNERTMIQYLKNGYKRLFLFFVQVISGAGHHIFADKPEVFNEYVNAACRFSDSLPDNDLGKFYLLVFSNETHK